MSRKSIEKIKEHMQAGYEDAKKCIELIQLISTPYKYIGTNCKGLVNEWES